MFTNNNGRITNDAGLVAMKFPQPVVKQLQVPGGFYTFYPKRNISMAWIQPQHVDYILNVKHSCCGGSHNQTFRLATQSDVNIWEGVSER